MLPSYLSMSFNLFLVTAACPGGWNVYKNSCYKVTDSQMNHGECQDYCSDRGAWRVSISDQQEHDFIATL